MGMGPPSRGCVRILDPRLPELGWLPGGGAWFQKVCSSAGAGRAPGAAFASDSAPLDWQNVAGPHDGAIASAKTSATGDLIPIPVLRKSSKRPALWWRPRCTRVHEKGKSVTGLTVLGHGHGQCFSPKRKGDHHIVIGHMV